MLEFPVSETIADGERIADIVFIAGGGNSQQAVLHFGADDEVSDDEIEPDTDARVSVADRVRSRSWNLGTQQSGEVGTGVEIEARCRRKSESDRRLDRQIDVGESRGTVACIVENVARRRSAFHDVAETGSESEMFVEKIPDIHSAA